jgi:hypothetical protein
MTEYKVRRGIYVRLCQFPSPHNYYPFLSLLSCFRYNLHTVHLNCSPGTHYASPSVVPLVCASLAAVTLLQASCQPPSSTNNSNFIKAPRINPYITQSHLPTNLIMSDRRQTYGQNQPRSSGGSANRRANRPNGRARPPPSSGGSYLSSGSTGSANRRTDHPDRAQPPPSNSEKTFSTTSNPKSTRSYSNIDPYYYPSNSGQNQRWDSSREAQGYSGTKSSSSGGGCGVM